MELNTEHREALMSELKKAKEQLKLSKEGRDIHTSDDVCNWFDIDIFLITERISLIEKSIIENKIDY
jgi:tRNA pseudouridine-54 N-methylase